MVFAFLGLNSFRSLAQSIIGADTVCAGSIQVYNISPPQPVNWTVTGGNIISSSIGGDTVTVQWIGAQNSIQTITASNFLINTSKNIYIKSNLMVCHNAVQVSLPANGIAKIPASDLLLGHYNSYQGFSVSIRTMAGIMLNDTVRCKDIGTVLMAKVINDCDGNSCWTSIRVEDKYAPVITCRTGVTMVPCNVNFDTIAGPTATDNCDPNPQIALSKILIDNSNLCTGVKLYRVWIATDKHGNSSTCSDTFMTDPLTSPPLVIQFPADTTWECSVFRKYPNVINPTALHPDTSKTGSGAPNVPLGIYCPYSYKHVDEFLKGCGGSFKLLRKWTLIRWCTDEVLTDEQIIKVIDRKGPEIEVPPIRITATIKGNLPIECSAMTCLPAPGIYDECSNWSIRIWTPAGEAIYTCGNDARDGGRIPPPGLTIGLHNIVYEATDECNNVTRDTVVAEVIDDIKPVAVCREFLIVALNNMGVAEVLPTSIDKGSNDNCCIGEMFLRRMSQPYAPFTESINFYCSDTADQVILRVYDCFENYNDCMVKVTVADKIKPGCIAPPADTVLCTALPETITQKWLNTFGNATYTDNCYADIIELPYQKSIDTCSAGQIIRSFVAVDKRGNVSETCVQIITVAKDPDWVIIFPPDWEGICGGKEEAPKVRIFNDGCNFIYTTHKDQIFTLAEDGLCYKIVRTHTVTNQCPDPGNGAVEIANNALGITLRGDTSFFQFRYQQIIKVMDNTPPKLTFPFTGDFCTFDDSCIEGNAFLPLTIDGECSQLFEIYYDIDLHRDGSINRSGTGFFEGTLPIGLHRIHYRVKDGCKNESRISVDFRIKDCKHVITKCEEGIIAELTADGTTKVCASMFDAGSYDNCEGTFHFSFSENLLDTCRIYRCSDVGDPLEIRIYTFDKEGNKDFCITHLTVQDNLFRCDSGIPLIGSISTEKNSGLGGVTVNLNSPSSAPATVKTSANGQFKFENALKGHDYSLTPANNIEPLNGVTTYDLVVISRHILGIEKLNSPYKMIAADVNRSGGITTLDMVELRKLILFINTTYPNNSSWRFVPRKYSFPNSQNPWQEIFPEVVNINNLSEANSTADFIAVKVGDVNSTATANLNGQSEDRSTTSLVLETKEQQLEEGKLITVHLKSTEFQKINGFQFTLNFNQSLLEFEALESNDITKPENYGLTKTLEGVVLVSWYESLPVPVENSEELVSLKFRAKGKSQLSDALKITSEYAKAEAYTGDNMEVRNIELVFNKGSYMNSKFELLQNMPNPFSEKTTIGFYLPETSQATLTVFEPTGKKVKVITKEYSKGYNEVILDKSDLPVFGLLFYRLETPTHNETKSMTLIGK